MKIRITSNPITMYGDFSRGQIIDDTKYPKAFLMHLVHEAGAAELVELKIDPPLQTKIDPPTEKKSVAPILSQSLPQDKVSQKPTRGRPRKQPQQ